MPVPDGESRKAIQPKGGTPNGPSGSTTNTGSIPVGHLNPRCGGCGGPHRFDTSVPSVVWNEVIRARGLSDYLCTSCIVEAFAKEGRSFTARLWGDDLPYGIEIEVRFRGEVAKDAAKIGEENTELRWRLHQMEEKAL